MVKDTEERIIENKPSELDEKFAAILENEEKILLTAVARTMKAYHESGKLSDLRDYEAAKKSLEAYRRKKAMERDPDKQTFRNIIEVLDYLQAEGWKIKKSALYQKQYAIKKQADGSMLKKDVDDFAARYLRKADGSDMDAADISKKIEAEIRKLTAEAEKKEIEILRLKGELVDRHEVEYQLADRAAFLKDSLKNFFHSKAPRIIEIVRGDMTLVADLIQFLIDETENLFDHYSKPLIFSVPIIREENEDEEINETE